MLLQKLLLPLFLILISYACSMFPKSTHETFSNKLFQNFRSHQRLEKAKFSETDFTMSHYAGKAWYYWCKLKMIYVFSGFLGLCVILVLLSSSLNISQVTYQTETFLDKNRDYVVVEHCNLFSSSKCSFVAGLFPSLPEESLRSSYKFSSVASRFKVWSTVILVWFYFYEKLWQYCYSGMVLGMCNYQILLLSCM